MHLTSQKRKLLHRDMQVVSQSNSFSFLQAYHNDQKNDNGQSNYNLAYKKKPISPQKMSNAQKRAINMFHLNSLKA